MHAIEKFRKIAAEDRFRGWPLVGTPVCGSSIPHFGELLHYQLRTGNGVEDYTSIIRHRGWSVCFGVVDVAYDHEYPDTKAGPHVVTVCQWKPGVNRASWELPPGGIGKLDPNATVDEIKHVTERALLKETGFGNGAFLYLGHVMIETSKYRGAGPREHGLPANLFLATGLTSLPGACAPNPNEIVETVLVPLEEFPEVLDSGLFIEVSAVACAYKALLKLDLLRRAR